MMVPAPNPEVAAEHQSWSLAAVQLVLEVTANEVAPALAATPWLEGATESEGGPLSKGFEAML